MRITRAAAIRKFGFERAICVGSRDFIEVAVIGEVGGHHAATLRDDLKWAVEQDRHVLLDLRGCQFLDSTAFAAILLTHRELLDRDRALAAYGGGAQVHRLFEVTGLDSALKLDQDRAAAISGLPGTGRS